MPIERTDVGRGRALGRSAGLVIGALAVVVVVAGLGGFLFGRSDPRRAASLIVSDFVDAEPAGTATAGPAPSSGDAGGGRVACGARDAPLAVEDQIATLRAGVVVVQYGPDVASSAVEAWAADHRDAVIAAPSGDLTDPLVATAWGRRLRLSTVNEQLLSAFVTAYGGQGPEDAGCP